MSKILIYDGHISSSDAFSLTRGTSDVLTISGSYVGIGTDTPDSLLHLKPSASVASHIQFEADTSTNN